MTEQNTQPRKKNFRPPLDGTRTDLPPLDAKTAYRGIDADLTAVEIAPIDDLPGFYSVTVAHDGEDPRTPLRVARWGLSANLDRLGVGVVSSWQAERMTPASNGDYANTPEILAHLERRGQLPKWESVGDPTPRSDEWHGTNAIRADIKRRYGHGAGGAVRHPLANHR